MGGSGDFECALLGPVSLSVYLCFLATKLEAVFYLLHAATVFFCLVTVPKQVAQVTSLTPCGKINPSFL